MWVLGAVCLGVFCGRDLGSGSAVITIETFEMGTNQEGGVRSAHTDYFVDFNGNPGRYPRVVLGRLHASGEYWLRNQSVVTGNYRARNMALVGIDMANASADSNVTGRKVTLIIQTTMELWRI